jgi:hypothetical protein
VAFCRCCGSNERLKVRSVDLEDVLSLARRVGDLARMASRKVDPLSSMTKETSNSRARASYFSYNGEEHCDLEDQVDFNSIPYF